MAQPLTHPEQAESMARGVQFPGLCKSCFEPAYLAVSCWGEGEPSPADGGAMHIRSFETSNRFVEELEPFEKFEEFTPLERWARG